MTSERRPDVERALARRARRRDFGPGPHIRAVRLVGFGPPGSRQLPTAYPFLPAVHQLERLDLGQPVTILCGENGVGKSTLIEAIAIVAGFPIAGGRLVADEFVPRATKPERVLADAIVLDPGARRPRDGFFLRAESFFNVAAGIDAGELEDVYGGRSLHAQSHGESFLALARSRFGADGLFILDEPESALSVVSQLALMALMQRAVLRGSQFILASHSPILLSYPAAVIYELSDQGLGAVAAEDTDPVRLTRAFLAAPERFLSLGEDRT